MNNKQIIKLIKVLLVQNTVIKARADAAIELAVQNHIKITKKTRSQAIAEVDSKLKRKELKTRREVESFIRKMIPGFKF